MTRTRVKRRRRLQSFLIRAVVIASILHYTALIFLYHGFLPNIGKDLLFSAQEIVEQPWVNAFAVPPQLSKKEPKLRVLWAIESKNTDEEQQRRQTLRDTYLTYVYESTSTNTTENIFCSLQEVESGKANNSDTCIFFYTFVLRENGMVSESDLIHLNQTQGLKGWLEYSMAMSEKHSLNTMAWVQPDVHAFPFELLDFLTPRMGTDFYAETPENALNFRCNGCLWDQESSRRTGRFLIASINAVQMLIEKGQECENTNNFHQMFKFCVIQSMSADSIIEMHTIGHQYRQPNLEQYRAEWDVHIKMLKAYQSFQRKNAIHYVSGKFSRTSHTYTNDFHSLRTPMSAWGLHPNQIFFYDSIFPDFIVNDYRWEQHIEFLKDLELDDTGAGYWFWKAPLVEHHLKLVKDGDFIIFGDLDLWNHFPWMMDLLETMVARQANFAAYQVFFPENQWTKRDLYELLCADVQDRVMPNDRSNQYAGGFFVLRKSPGANDLIREYTKLISNYHLVSDEKSILPEYPEFREHRRDQSILSLLLKCKYMESGKQEFFHPILKDLGWWEAFTFHLNPLK